MALPQVKPFIISGGLAIAAAGIISAISAFSPSYLASWTVAYLVLVVGVAQVLLGLGQANLAPEVPSRRTVFTQVALFNLGNVGVLAGSLLELFVLSVIGSVLLVVVLISMAWYVRGTNRRGPWLIGYVLVLGILAISIPVGLVIANARI